MLVIIFGKGVIESKPLLSLTAVDDQFLLNYASIAVPVAFCVHSSVISPKRTFPHWPQLNVFHLLFEGVFFICQTFFFIPMIWDLFNKRLLKVCVCLHTRHISISPHFNHYILWNLSIESRICTRTTYQLTMATVRSFLCMYLYVVVTAVCRFI